MLLNIKHDSFVSQVPVDICISSNVPLAQKSPSVNNCNSNLPVTELSTITPLLYLSLFLIFNLESVIIIPSSGKPSYSFSA